jgi:hypothetical protein
MIADVSRQARVYFGNGSSTEEPTVGSLWKHTIPDLEKGLAVYDKQESPSTPEAHWNSLAGCLVQGTLVKGTPETDRVCRSQGPHLLSGRSARPRFDASRDAVGQR